MGYFSLTGRLSSLQISLFTLLNGKRVGTDSYGNRYYEAKGRKGLGRTRRWVMYKHQAEASHVPPLWHGWLHHQTNDIPPSDKDTRTHAWQKKHQPNMTGTDLAYRPPGHVLSKNKRDKAVGDYEAWKP